MIRVSRNLIRIEEMSSDFADMLKDTLSKMQDRIEFANGKD